VLTDEDLSCFASCCARSALPARPSWPCLNASGQAEIFGHIDPPLDDRPAEQLCPGPGARQSGLCGCRTGRRGPQDPRVALLGAPTLGGSAAGSTGIYPLPQDFGQLAERIEQAYHRYRNVDFLRNRLQQSLILILTLVLMLTVLLAMLVAFNAARRLSQPIRELAVATEEITAGRFPDELSVASRDELGFLVNSFNVMTRELAASRQALEAQRRYLEIVLGRLSAGVLAFDGDGLLGAFNDSAGRILGLDPVTDRGQSVSALRAARPDLEPLLDIIATRGDGPGGDWRQEIQLAGRERPLVLVCRGSDLPPETGGQVVVFDDVTVLDEAQREAAWAEVARRLAHEVKNPLTPIQLAAERLQYKLENVLEPDQLELLTKATTTIRAQVDTLKRLVDAFGDYARPASLKLEPVRLESLINEVEDLYASGAVPISFSISVTPETPLVLADPGRLRQVLLNLVRNAQEAHSDGRPELRLKLEPSTRDGQAGVALTLQDNGPGFADEVLERIFEPYVTTKPRGTGLGLAIVRRIIEEHGGHIAVENAEAGGARVRIWLPATQPASRSQLQ
jgi:nitrogen fixation/metabolism regulation signal transduction histidine kinase